MIALAERPIESVEPVGTVQVWESETGYPDETPIFSDLGWAQPQATPRFPAWLRGVAVTEPTPLVTTQWTHMLGDQMGRVWMPWAFAPSLETYTAVSSVGMGVMAAGVVLLTGGSGLMSTTVFPVGGVHHLINPGQITAETTPLWEEARAIRLLTPGLLPRMLHVRETGELPSIGRDPRSTEALGAIADIARWLHRSPKDVAELGRFSLRTLRYWGSGKQINPRPSTVRHLYEVHSFVGSLVRRIGAKGARDWLAMPSDAGNARIDELAREDGVKVLLREATAVLFSEAPASERPVPESVITDEMDRAAEPYTPATHKAPPRRARRAPQSRE
jgi:hypothetical protein